MRIFQNDAAGPGTYSRGARSQEVGGMRRPVLLSMVVVGAVVSAIAGLGTFAPFTDRATSGPNSVASGEQPKAAELKVAFPVGGPSDCETATYVDDSTTPGWQEADVQPGYRSPSKFFCLKNDGASALTVTSTVIDLVDLDTGCTGDEATLDTTCGGDQAGELGVVLFWDMTVWTSCGSTGSNVFGNSLSAPYSIGLGTLDPGEVGCYSASVYYPLNRTAEDVQRAQSDTASWKFAFDATT